MRERERERRRRIESEGVEKEGFQFTTQAKGEPATICMVNKQIKAPPGIKKRKKEGIDIYIYT